MSSGTIFDLLDQDLPEGKEGFFQAAKNAPSPKDDSFLNQVKDYGKTILKGTVEGISQLGRVMGPLQDKKGRSTSQILQEQTNTLNENLPTDEAYVQSSIRRGLKQAPTAIATPFGSVASTATKALGAGFLGEGAKELGAPEWVQTAAELTSYIGPDITKKLLSEGKNKELIEFGRKMGMTDEQLTPLLQSDFKKKWLSKLSPKRGSTQSSLESTKSSLQSAYKSIQKGEGAAQTLSSDNQKKLFSKLYDAFLDMPSEVRDLVMKDFHDFMKKPITGETLMNLYADVNHYMSGNAKQLSLLKNPLKEAISSISPELGKDFEMINKLYSKYFDISSKLKPNLMSDLISAGESLGIFTSAVTGNYPILGTILSEKAAKKLAQQMLINPRLQQLSRKMVQALNQNNFSITKKLIDEYARVIKDGNPEAYAKLKEMDDDELQSLFNQKKSATQKTM